jgi:hypothetical protein
MIDLLKTEVVWFPSAIVIAFITTAILIAAYRRRGVERRPTITRALNVFYGCVIGIMGTGHILVVTIMALEGTLSNGVRWFLYPLGAVLAVPAWILVASTTPRRMAMCNAWLAIALIVQGPSAPLAVPAILNLIYLWSARRWIERTVVTVSALLYATLSSFATALALSGGSFAG